MKDNVDVEFVGVVVKVNGKRRVFKKPDCYFYGWECSEYEDNGVNLVLTDGRKKYKVNVE